MVHSRLAAVCCNDAADEETTQIFLRIETAFSPEPTSRCSGAKLQHADGVSSQSTVA